MNRHYIKTSLHGLMYIRFVLYTCMLQLLDNLLWYTYFMCFRFCVLTKLIFGIKDKNYDIYMFHVYWILSIASCFKVFKYHVFVFGRVLDKPYFLFKIQVLEKYSFWFLVKMIRHKNSSYWLIFELNFLPHVYISMQNDKTIFGDF